MMLAKRRSQEGEAEQELTDMSQVLDSKGILGSEHLGRALLTLKELSIFGDQDKKISSFYAYDQRESSL